MLAIFDDAPAMRIWQARMYFLDMLDDITTLERPGKFNGEIRRDHKCINILETYMIHLVKALTYLKPQTVQTNGLVVE